MSEADARIVVDDLLKQAGWNPRDQSQVRTEVRIVSGPRRVAEHPFAYQLQPSRRSADGDEIPTGFADYVLYGQNGTPLAVIEAKRSAIQPYTAKQQALPYAQSINAPFIFLTNGELIYFWDYTNDDARIVNSFFSRRDLEHMLDVRENQRPLAEIPIPQHYTRQSEPRDVRPYQREAMQALDHAVELGKRHYLIELPTGTGKTDLICLYLKRLIQARRAERILFLVDRDQLAEQAIGAIQDLLHQYSSYWLKAGMERQERQITVALLQTMTSRYPEYTSGYFDVVVADECHRSIYGAWQTALTHFDALHIGLTATPAKYIERNLIGSTSARNRQPDFRYDIRDAFRDGYLTPYRFASGITEIIAEGARVGEEEYDPAQFERQWTNEHTNRLMVEKFDRLAWASYEEAAPGQRQGPGKAIVFAITKHHAARLAQYLDALHPEAKGQYAEVITSDVSDPAGLIRRFKFEPYPQVAVSVGMLDPGFDCREVLHPVLCRPIHSPILYQQIRGRGTRTAPHIQKRGFVIYDFFGNPERFNDSETEIFSGGGEGQATDGRSAAERFADERELIELGLEDEWLVAVSYVEVGPDGERIDKHEYQNSWERAIREAAEDDETLSKVRSGEPLSEQEETELAQRLNRERYYFNEDNLRRAYRRPGASLVDFIRHALGAARMKSREEELTENFQAWLVSKSFTPQQAQYLSLLKNRGILHGNVDIGELFRPPLSILNAAQVGVELFGQAGLREVVDEMNEAVFSRQAS